MFRSAFDNNAGVLRDPESRKHEHNALESPKVSSRENAHEPVLSASIAKSGGIMESKPATPQSTNIQTSPFFANQCQDSIHNHRLSCCQVSFGSGSVSQVESAKHGTNSVEKTVPHSAETDNVSSIKKPPVSWSFRQLRDRVLDQRKKVNSIHMSRILTVIQTCGHKLFESKPQVQWQPWSKDSGAIAELSQVRQRLRHILATEANAKVVRVQFVNSARHQQYSFSLQKALAKTFNFVLTMISN